MFRPWKPFKHPQLGDVEIGGTLPTVGMHNPPNELLPEICENQSQMYLRVAAMAPGLDLKVGYANNRLEIEVSNPGYLGTYVLDSAKKLAGDCKVYVEVEALSGVTVDPRDARIEIGHLEGWGRGLFNDYLFGIKSRGSVSRRVVGVPVRGKGRVRVKVKGLRVGEVVREITVE